MASRPVVSRTTTSRLRLVSAWSSKVSFLLFSALPALGVKVLTPDVGWDEGVLQMKVGEKATLDISA